ncbi:DNA mismatch repair protein MutS, partial [Pantoea agglomerans]|nr:DNA mismatch repair protein MutS [Pantoea agglomerans]
VERGYKVAICEQTEDPKQAKGVVKREVVQLITPGTMMEGKNLSDKENNYIATISLFADNKFGFAYSDLSTGESKATILTGIDSLLNELSLSGAKEVVVSDDFSKEYLKRLQERGTLTLSIENDTDEKDMHASLLQGINEQQLK